MSHARSPLDPDLPEDVSSIRISAPVDPARFERMVNTYVDLVWRSLLRYGVPSADVDDATQQVFMVANAKLEAIPVEKERSFLFAVASRVALHSRRARARLDSARERFSKTTVDSPLDPEQLTQRTQTRELLDRILDCMPDDERTVFVLFELEELAVKEISDILEVTVDTVIRRLRRARTVFKKKADHLKHLRREGAL